MRFESSNHIVHRLIESKTSEWKATQSLRTDVERYCEEIRGLCERVGSCALLASSSNLQFDAAVSIGCIEPILHGGLGDCLQANGEIDVVADVEAIIDAIE
jgi:hypothetical protein